ncbi:hypothetical protein ABIB40_001913 [Pedobacter sp. UYP30]|uniref:hypothetical protein n=1 Tax=Pedobacter sp. UYP30 TaxID=1756400 RepID=UPI0033981D9E
MKTILIINDQSPEAEHAAWFALVLAQHIQANIILANTVVLKMDEPDYGWSEDLYDDIIAEPVHSLLMRKLRCRIKLQSGFFPKIQEIELADDPESIFFLAARNDIYMVVKGMNEFLPQALLHVNLCINTLINKLQVPLLLVPSSWKEKGFKRLVY